MLKLPKGYVCYRADVPLSLNGRLTDSAWDAAPWTEDFVDIEGDVRPLPAFQTRVKMLWDDDYLYIGAKMEEPHVWATLTEHDSIIFQDNDFEIFIDPDGDNHDYYEIEINALNTVWDLRLPKPYRDGGSAIHSWDIPGLKTAVHVEGTLNDASDVDSGWSVELAIPWAALGEFARRPAPPGNGDQWRINFSRVEWDVEIVDGQYVKIPNRPEHNWVWTPQGAIDMHRPERWGIVQFSAETPGSALLRLDHSGEPRDLLMSVYYAQRRHHRITGEWAADLPSLAGFDDASALEAVEFSLTDAGYQASTAFTDDHGQRRRLFVREDSRLWSE